MKLTKAQKEIVDLMRNGWDMGVIRPINHSKMRVWVQYGGVGNGGEVKNIRSNVFMKMLSDGVIKEIWRKIPIVIYKLADEYK